MKKINLSLSLSLLLLSFTIKSQNTSERIIANNQGLHLGGYGQIDMNMPLSDDNVHNNAKLDVHRLVTFLV